jgi:uncharacterized protein (DUF1684 family)
VALAAPLVIGAGASYQDEIRAWREQRETRLKADGGWLTVAGLFWLKDGVNRFGTDPANEIVLPADSAPAKAGVFHFKDGTTTVAIEPGVTVTAGGKPVTTMDLKPDSAGAPDVLTLGPLQMLVIERQDRYAIRLKDMNSRLRKDFKGLSWFEVKEPYRVTARFVPYGTMKPVAVPNILGQTQMMPSPGYALFTVGGKEVRLEGVLEDPHATELFFIFRDLTTGKETYPAGRFLYSDLPKDGQVVLDFNKAYNPPCAFTPYATCPLPPKENWLPVRVEAGELSYGHHP